jgi:hypothetical protein
MKKSKGYVPRALREVWQWKHAIHDEVKHLPLDDALDEIARRAHATAVQYGFAEGKTAEPRNIIAADRRQEYQPRPPKRVSK